jgi:membrane protease YdiL (CAAX protease family)
VDQPVHADQENPVMTWAEHAFAATLLMLLPVPLWSVARLTRRIASGDARARIRAYGWGMASQWTLTLLLWMIWQWAGRPFAALGIVAPSGTAAWITIALCLATAIFYAAQIRTVIESEQARASLRAQLEPPGIRAVIPATAADMRVFAAVSVTAGICEELLYRGFVLWYLTALLPRGVAIAAAVALFGIGHAYQGVRGVLMTTTVGGIAMAVYLWTGSLIAPMVMHATVDLANGFIGYRSVSGRGVTTTA